jgi:hypothetical protein
VTGTRSPTGPLRSATPAGPQHTSTHTAWRGWARRACAKQQREAAHHAHTAAQASSELGAAHSLRHTRTARHAHAPALPAG